MRWATVVVLTFTSSLVSTGGVGPPVADASSLSTELELVTDGRATYRSSSYNADLVVIDGDGQVEIYGPSGGEPLLVLDGWLPELSRDGSTLLHERSPGGTAIYDLELGVEVRFFEGLATTGIGGSMSQDGSTVLLASSEDMYAYDRESDTLHEIVGSDNWPNSPLILSEQNQSIFFSAGTDETSELFAVSWPGGELTQLTSGVGSEMFTSTSVHAWNSDGSVLALREEDYVDRVWQETRSYLFRPSTGERIEVDGGIERWGTWAFSSFAIDNAGRVFLNAPSQGAWEKGSESFAVVDGESRQIPCCFSTVSADGSILSGIVEVDGFQVPAIYDLTVPASEAVCTIPEAKSEFLGVHLSPAGETLFVENGTGFGVYRFKIGPQGARCSHATESIPVLRNDPRNVPSGFDPAVASWWDFPDSDQDGIPDYWEERGVWVKGERLDLPGLGADPKRKDLFVYVDYQAGEAFSDGVKERLVAAFDAAPLSYPGVKDGVTLHFEIGSEIPERIIGEDFCECASGYRQTRLYSGFATSPRAGSSSVPQLYKYVLNVDSLRSSDWRNIRLGNALRVPGNHLVTGLSAYHDNRILAAMRTQVWPSEAADHIRAANVLHELGHLFGLRHHGAVKHPAASPEYTSVMSYAYNTTLIDYSRTDTVNRDWKMGEPDGSLTFVLGQWGEDDSYYEGADNAFHLGEPGTSSEEISLYELLEVMDAEAVESFAAKFGPTSTSVPPLMCSGEAVTIDMTTSSDKGAGTSSNDVILGTAGDDVIEGLAGDDVICGGGGDDEINGGPGRDIIDAGDGDDLVYGGGGNDSIQGGDGRDTIFGQYGGDTIRGGDGDDLLLGGPGYDTLYGQAGNDNIQGAGGNDKLWGGSGNDNIYGKPGNDLMYGEAGDDEMYAASGDDKMYGGPGQDRMQGANGDDHIDGGPDDDILYGQANNDFMTGRDGNDTLYAGSGDDELRGGDGQDNLQGANGNDRIYGQADADVLYGQSGVDLLDGGGAVDTCWGGQGDTLVHC